MIKEIKNLDSFEIREIIYSKEDRVWYNSKMKLHRNNNLPAVEKFNNKYWFLNGKCHREKGPARIYPTVALISSLKE